MRHPDLWTSAVALSITRLSILRLKHESVVYHSAYENALGLSITRLSILRLKPRLIFPMQISGNIRKTLNNKTLNSEIETNIRQWRVDTNNALIALNNKTLNSEIETTN